MFRFNYKITLELLVLAESNQVDWNQKFMPGLVQF